MFKLVYPFSPALIQALVAVSSALQRERTALKIMLQLLVNRRDTLRLGDVIPLGDLWDVVAHGDEAFTDVMRVNFENAKKLYQNKLRPMLEEQHQIDLEVDRERAADSDEIATRLKLYENDDRLVKSLLLSALVHGVEALKNMTCMRLAALNHGSIRSRIPGREHQVVAQKLRTWAGMVGEIRVGEEPTNPTVSIQLSGVDTEGIIEAARVYDNPGNRQYRLRQMLFKSLGVPEQDEMYISHAFWWRGSKRSCDVLFTNVRALPDESLRSADDWKLVVDFPFDAEGHSPIEDLDRVNKFREKGERHRTLVWLPSFFSPRTQAELGKLVIIDRLLLGNNLDQHAQHLSLQDRQTARLLLQNQQSALSQRLLQAVEAAFAIRSEPTPGTLDAAYDMSRVALPVALPEPGAPAPGGCEPRRGPGAPARPGAVAPVPEAPEVRPGDQAGQGSAAGAGGLPGGGPHARRAGLRRGQGGPPEAQERLQPARTGADVRDALRAGQLLEEPLQPPAGGLRAAAPHGGGPAAVDGPAGGAGAAP